MDSYFLQVEPRDELTAIIDKIVNTQAERVYVLISENSRIAQSALNFRLIKREADALGKEIIIVSSSPQVQNLALKSSLQVHLETAELRHGAEQTGVPSSAPAKISDVFAPLTSEKEPPAPAPTAKPSAKISFKPATDQPKPRKCAPPSVSDKDKTLVQFWSNRLLAPSLPLLKAPQAVLPRIGRLFLDKLYKFRSFRNFRTAMLALIGTAAILFAATFYSILPRAEVHITPVIEEAVLEMALTAGASIARPEPEKFLVPAQIFEKTVTHKMTVSATGEKELRDKASGTIKVYNAYSSSPQTLVVNTRFVSEEGKLFRTAETSVVPGAEVEDGKIVPSFTTVRVLAAEPGEEYNIDSASFSIPGFKGTPKYLGFYGKSEKPMSGGKIGTAKVVTEDDYNSARRKIEGDLLKLADTELGLLLPDGLFIPPAAKSSPDIKITSSAGIGDTASEFILEGNVEIRAFAISVGEIVDMLDADFAMRFPDMKLVAASAQPQYKVTKTDFKKGAMEFTITMPRLAYMEVNADEVVSNISGQSEESVRTYLGGLKNIKEARITFWPFWVNTIPTDAARIKVRIEGLPQALTY